MNCFTSFLCKFNYAFFCRNNIPNEHLLSSYIKKLFNPSKWVLFFHLLVYENNL